MSTEAALSNDPSYSNISLGYPKPSSCCRQSMSLARISKALMCMLENQIRDVLIFGQNYWMFSFFWHCTLMKSSSDSQKSILQNKIQPDGTQTAHIGIFRWSFKLLLEPLLLAILFNGELLFVSLDMID